MPRLCSVLWPTRVTEWAVRCWFLPLLLQGSLHNSVRAQRQKRAPPILGTLAESSTRYSLEFVTKAFHERLSTPCSPGLHTIPGKRDKTHVLFQRKTCIDARLSGSVLQLAPPEILELRTKRVHAAATDAVNLPNPTTSFRVRSTLSAVSRNRCSASRGPCFEPWVSFLTIGSQPLKVVFCQRVLHYVYFGCFYYPTIGADLRY